ncbi:carbohydrate ABC transporter permease [Geochorda subterranea]|uniref:Carbohydrate ABC transporter permease n=1 Tax=Geochorda subterranea TaxID=3109564 RepID=A0ABZ1BM41_9FIRM|nr:carbohydrate ABC transporter permease [Limnochorda sp. LNt]WRP13653.1 carbohydrate ABC transporter permease [Limnochorda sp. LNt]
MRRLTVYLLLAAMVIVSLGPVAWMVSTAFKPKSETFALPTYWLPKSPTLDNFVEAWRTQPIGRQFFNSLIVASSTTGLATALAILAGYGVSRFSFGQRDLFLRLILVGQMFPGVLLVLPYFILMRRLGLINTYWALVLAYTSFALPLATWMMRGYMMAVPRELDDAAMVDGCTRLQSLVRVVLPVAKPGIVATMIYTFMVAWSEYLFALVLTTTKHMQLLTVGVGSLLLQYGIEWNQLMAIGSIAVVPILAIFAFMERYLVAGLTAGAVKG